MAPSGRLVRQSEKRNPIVHQICKAHCLVQRSIFLKVNAQEAVQAFQFVTSRFGCKEECSSIRFFHGKSVGASFCLSQVSLHRYEGLIVGDLLPVSLSILHVAMDYLCIPVDASADIVCGIESTNFSGNNFIVHVFDNLRYCFNSLAIKIRNYVKARFDLWLTSTGKQGFTAILFCGQ
jgi:hypothetical protein